MSNFCVFTYSVATISSSEQEKLLLADENFFNSLNNTISNRYTNSVSQSSNNLNCCLSNLIKNKTYVPFTSCVLEHILTSTNLSHLEKLYYLLADALALINANSKGNDNRRAIALPANGWAKRLNCSRAQVFSMQKSLSNKGCFIIAKKYNKSGQNMRNLIIPTLPDSIFEDLNKSAPNNKEEFSFFDQHKECKRSYLDKTKVFVKINYHLLALILSDNSLNSFQKIIWLDLFTSSLKFKQFSITISYQELADKYFINKKLISKTIISLQKLGFLAKKEAFIKKEFSLEARQDKALWNITVSLPQHYFKQLTEIVDRSGVDNINTSSVLNPLELRSKEQQGSISDPRFTHSRPLLNKNFKINKDRSTKSNFCEEKFLKDVEREEISEIKKGNCRKTSSKQIKGIFGKAKELKDFYPLSKEDCSLLQISSRREFSLNAMNEILLDMSKRLADRVFYSKKGFMSYMSKVFAWEKRDAVKTSNENFKIKKNHSEEEISLQEKEQFLTEIEHNLQNSPQWYLKKKLASVFDRDKSYELLKAYKTSSRVGDRFEIYLSKYIELTNLEREIILSQVKATYESIDLEDGELGFIEKLEIIMPEIGQKRLYNRFKSEEAYKLPDNIWGRVRQNLMSRYGEAIDQHWFSKLEAKIDKNNKTIELTAPSSFIKDWITTNYLELIETITQRNEYRLVFS